MANSNVLGGLAQFLLYAAVAFAAQNAVFGRSLGTTRIIQLVEDVNLDSALFCVLLTLVQVLSAAPCWAVNQLMANYSWRPAVRPLAFFLCHFMVLAVIGTLIRLTGNGPRRQHAIKLLPLATFNTCLLGTHLVCALQSYNLIQYLGFALGSGAGYMLAVLLASEGQRKLRHSDVPAAFRGMPITLIYLGILSMVIYSFTGHMLAY